MLIEKKNILKLMDRQVIKDKSYVKHISLLLNFFVLKKIVLKNYVDIAF